MKSNNEYIQLIADIRKKIVTSRYTATRLVNREQLKLYFAIGMKLDQKIASHDWGAKVLEQIAGDLKKQMPGLRGFSHRNLKNMRQFYTAYADDSFGQVLMAGVNPAVTQSATIGQSATAQFNELVLKAFFGISFTHHLLLLNKCSHLDERIFYMHQAATSLWPVGVLEHQIKEGFFRKQGKLPNNFEQTVSFEMTDKARQIFKDEYLLDFLNLSNDADEKKMEVEIVDNIRDFILRMGKGFSFIANQFRVEVGDQEFFIDLLFYNRILQSLVIFELKKTPFKPEYSGQLNFYLNVVDDLVKLPNENPSIGIILCKEKNDAVVHFSIKTINTPMGVATYKTSTKIPRNIQVIFPNPDELKKLLYKDKPMNKGTKKRRKS